MVITVVIRGKMDIKVQCRATRHFQFSPIKATGVNSMRRRRKLEHEEWTEKVKIRLRLTVSVNQKLCGRDNLSDNPGLSLPQPKAADLGGADKSS